MIPGKKGACDCIEVTAISSPIREGRLNELSVVDSFLGNIPVAYHVILTVAIPCVRNRSQQAKGKFIRCQGHTL